MNKQKTRKKVVAFLLSMLMLISLFQNISYTPIAEGGETESVASESDAETMQYLAEEPESSERYDAQDLQLEEEYLQDAASVTGFTIDNLICNVEVNGVIVDIVRNPNTVIPNGAKMSLEFDWSMQNSQHKENLVFDLSAVNIKLSNIGESPLPQNGSGENVGTYYVQDNKMYVKLFPQFAAQDNIEGKAKFDGVADAVNEGETSTTQTEFQLVGKKFSSQVKYPASSIEVNKQANGTIKKDTNGKWLQTYEVTMTGKNGKVVIEKITDTFTNNKLVTSLKNFSVSLPNGSSNTFADIDAVSQFLNQKELKENEKIKITYDAVLDGEDLKYLYYDSLSSIDSSKKTEIEDSDNNTFNVKYKNNDSEVINKPANTWNVNVQKPSVTKDGSFSTETGKENIINWTITLKTGDFDKIDLKSITDTIDTTKHELVDSSVSTKINDLDNWTKQEDGVYEFKYQTKVKDDVMANPVPQDIKNTVTTTYEHNETDYTYTADKVVTKKGNLIKKEHVGNVDADGYIKWNITVSIPASGLTNVGITDSPEWTTADLGNNVTGMDLSDYKVEVDGNKVYENKAQTTTAPTYISNVDINSSCKVMLNDEYVNQKKGQNIVITVYTKALDEALQLSQITFKNKATLEASDISDMQSNVAEYVHTNSVTKTGVKSTTKRNTIDYTVVATIPGSYQATDTFIFKDVLPDDLEIINNSVKAYYYYDEYYNREAKQDKVAFNKNTSTIEVKLSDTEYERKDIKQIKITYSASVKADKLKAYVLAGTEKTFENKVSVYQNAETNRIGDASCINKMTPGDVVDKKGTYTSGRTANYTIIINPDKIQFNDVAGKTITGVDECGYQLIPEMATVKAYKYTGNGDPETDTANWSQLGASDFSYTIKKLSGGKTRTTYTLPDGEAIKLTYTSSVNIYSNDANGSQNGSFTEEGSRNTFTLKGYTQNTTSSSTSFSQQITNSNVTVTGNLKSITLYKFWTDSGNRMIALKDSEFALYECAYDTASKKITDSKHSLRRDNITQQRKV